MTILKWDEVGTRVFENGLDRGVIYLPDNSAVPWSGLTSVTEKYDKSSTSIYYDGAKVGEIYQLSDFKASIKAITYPDELLDLDGVSILRTGVFVADQHPKPFSMSYRTAIGNDLEGDLAGYKIHILFDLVASPSDKVHASASINPTLTEFEWEVRSVPPEGAAYRPSGHIIVDSRKVPYWLLDGIERILYGDAYQDAEFMTPAEFIEYLNSAVLWEITDNGDGTWTAYTENDELYTDLGDGEFQLEEVTATFPDADSYIITDG